MKKDIKTKGIVIVLDGLGDLPVRQLGEMTPLEAAHTPNLDFLATRGKMGYIYPVKPGYSPSSRESLVSLFGNEISTSSAGQIEAYGAGIDLEKGDLALRANFSAIDSYENRMVNDRRSLRTLLAKESRLLTKAINKISFPYPFEFVSTGSYKGILILRGDYSDKIIGNDLTYRKGTINDIQKFEKSVALSNDEKAKNTAEILNALLFEIYLVLNEHPINKKRKNKGLLPANFLLVRSPGIGKPRLKQYNKWASLTYSSLERGFSLMSGMKNYSFKYPKLKTIDVYKNLWNGLKIACKSAEKVVKKNIGKSEYIYIHFSETDVPGHDNKPFEKKAILEYIDKTFFKFVARVAPMKKIKVVVTGSHSTPCRLKSHSSDPVPVLFYDFSLPKEKKCFSERSAKRGVLKRVAGIDFLKEVGFTR